MKKILIISSLLLASMVSVAQPAIREPIYSLSDSNRERIYANPDYFLQILAIQDSLMAGQDISVNHLQSLMPQNRDEFLTFAILEEYACEKKGTNVVMSEKNIFESVWKYAIADTLDMMERYVEWFNWCDGWIAEEVWTVGVYVEEKHPEKFQQLLRTIAPQWYPEWLVWRDESLKWRNSEKKE